MLGRDIRDKTEDNSNEVKLQFEIELIKMTLCRLNFGFNCASYKDIMISVTARGSESSSTSTSTCNSTSSSVGKGSMKGYNTVTLSNAVLQSQACIRLLKSA